MLHVWAMRKTCSTFDVRRSGRDDWDVEDVDEEELQRLRHEQQRQQQQQFQQQQQQRLVPAEILQAPEGIRQELLRSWAAQQGVSPSCNRSSAAANR